MTQSEMVMHEGSTYTRKDYLPKLLQPDDWEVVAAFINRGLVGLVEKNGAEYFSLREIARILGKQPLKFSTEEEGETTTE